MSFDFFGDWTFWAIWIAGILISIPLFLVGVPNIIPAIVEVVAGAASLNIVSVIVGALFIGIFAAAFGFFFGPLGMGLLGPTVTSWVVDFIPQLKPLFKSIAEFLPWLF